MSESRYFRVKKNSDKGREIEAFFTETDKCLEATKALAKKYGFKEWRMGYWVVSGGISSVRGFSETPSSKLWRNGDNRGEYFPSKKSKEGKAILADFEALPVVNYSAANKVFGVKENRLRCPGFTKGSAEYFGFSVGVDWSLEDCKDYEEITITEYRKLYENDEK